MFIYIHKYISLISHTRTHARVHTHTHTQDDKLSAFDEDGHMVESRVIFIYTFVIVMVIVMLQVVVAVLLDNFFKQSQAQQEIAEENKKQDQRQAYSLNSTLFDASYSACTRELTFESFHQLDNILTRRKRYHLDLFMDYLAQNFYSQRDLDERISRMYRYLDCDRRSPERREKKGGRGRERERERDG